MGEGKGSATWGTALQTAARSRNVAVVLILLDDGADIEAKSVISRIGALHMPASFGLEAAVRVCECKFKEGQNSEGACGF